MKKIVVMSDSHGYHAMIDLVRELEPDGDCYVVVIVRQKLMICKIGFV